MSRAIMQEILCPWESKISIKKSDWNYINANSKIDLFNDLASWYCKTWGNTVKTRKESQKSLYDHCMKVTGQKLFPFSHGKCKCISKTIFALSDYLGRKSLMLCVYLFYWR